ncbi:MAG TPA: LysR family transcriptional regulator, partial [Hellea balneolensis]|nr:LysR family transcriptional regulator [Hellea balneolensis]
MSLIRDLTFKQIRAYEAVVRTASITRAAEELCVTPPAISSQIKTLKHLVGTEILTREQDGLKPTQAGLEILALHERIMSAINTSAQKLDAIKSGKAGDVGIAVVSTGKYYAPHIFSAFMAAYPDIKLRPMIGNRRMVLSALENRSADLAIMGRPPARLDVEATTLGDHPNILIAAPDHPLAHAKNIKPEQLLKHTLLLREMGSGTRMLARRFMDRFGEG